MNNQLAFSPLGLPKESRKQRIESIMSYIDRLHWDFMDNSYVPYEGINLDEIEDLNINNKPIDVHLMVNNPRQYLEKISTFDNQNIQNVIGQIEVLEEPREFIEECRSLGLKGGLAISPETEPALIEPFILDIDSILILGVIPGKSGQSIIPSTLDTLHFIRNQREDLDILFDGGANPENSKIILERGANIIVSGGFLQNSENPEYAKDEFFG